MKRIATLFLVALLVPSAAAAQRRGTPSAGAPAVLQPGILTPTPTPACCAITAIVGVNVTAQDAATGTRFQFRVTDRAVLGTLAVGTPVWADLAAGRAGLAVGSLCCAIFGAAAFPSVPAAAAVPAPSVPAAVVVPPPPVPAAAVVPARRARAASVRDIVTEAPVAAAFVTPTDLMGTIAVESPVHGGWEAEMTVTLSKPAPETDTDDLRCRGVLVLAESSQPAIAPVPVSLCLQPGETTESFKIRTLGVATDTPVTISARYLDFPARTATLDVLAPAVDRIELAAATAAGGDTLDAVLHLTGPPPASPPIKVYLGSTDPAVATVPATVTLPPNATTVPFKIPIHPVAENTEVRIRASRNPLPSDPPQGDSGGGIRGALAAAQQVAIIATDIKSVEIEVLPAELFNVGTSNLYPVTGGVSLDGLAPPDGALVQLTSSRPDLAKVPPSVTIAAGQRGAEFDVVTSSPPSDATSVRITATYSGVSKSEDFAVQRPDVVVRELTIKDRYGNPVTTSQPPQDGQPLTMCAGVSVCGSSVSSPDCPSAPVPPTVALHYDYKTYHPTTQTSSGREGDLQVPIDNASDGGFTIVNMACMDVGGVDEGGWLEIDLRADPTNQVAERSEGNNAKSIKITRP